MSGFRETTEHECIYARQQLAQAKAQSQVEIAAIKALPLALERYRVCGGRVTTLPSCIIGESDYHKKFLRNYQIGGHRSWQKTRD